MAFIEAFRAQHYNPKAIIATSGPNEGAQFLRQVGVGTAEGVFIPNTGWYPGFTTYQNDQFTQAYLKKYGGNTSDISATTAEAFAACQLLEQAVDQAHSTDNAKLVQILHSTTFNSLQGPLRFDADGRNTIGISNLFQWIHGQLVPVYPFTNSQANPEYPKQNWS